MGWSPKFRMVVVVVVSCFVARFESVIP